ncbi:MAG: hypothetical protein WBG46_12870 [Nonlabens sp.]
MRQRSKELQRYRLPLREDKRWVFYTDKITSSKKNNIATPIAYRHFPQGKTQAIELKN